MKNMWKVVIPVFLVITVAGVIWMKKGASVTQSIVPDTNIVNRQRPAESNATLPRLVDIGAGKCIPCKMMGPILEELKSEYKGRLEVIVYDIWQNPNQARNFAVNIIPTQIFFDKSGKELFRHEGFMSKEDILAKWNELGIFLGKEKSNEH